MLSPRPTCPVAVFGRARRGAARLGLPAVPAQLPGLLTETLTPFSIAIRAPEAGVEPRMWPAADPSPIASVAEPDKITTTHGAERIRQRSRAGDEHEGSRIDETNRNSLRLRPDRPRCDGPDEAPAAPHPATPIPTEAGRRHRRALHPPGHPARRHRRAALPAG